MSITGSASDASKKNRRFLGCFFVVFMLMGMAFSVMFAWPLVQIIKANDWRQTPCTILTSEVEHHSSSKGAGTYSVAVTYEYLVDGERHTSSRYKFMSGSSSGYDGKKEIVDRLAPGSQAVCYVNRRDPDDAVIERGFTSDILLIFIPLIFVAIGAGGIYGVFIRKPKPLTASVPATAGVAAPSPRPKAGKSDGTLKAKASPGGRLGCAIGIALFWNGITSIFLVEMVSGWMNGKGDGCMTAFLVPFVLAGLGLIIAVIYYFLALFNPRPVLRVGNGTGALGETVDLEWETTGNVDRVQAFEITFEGREEATYKRGTSTSTDKSVFFKKTLVDFPLGKELRHGKTEFTIPADTMHTFKSRNNKILWCFKITGDIPRWPDIDEEFEFEVLPQRLPAEKKP